ncbi:hypothetical protein TWF506_009615 [Arthrobotrys conoides]|uniref:Uncharacterized protein n=1 Tax=Arthrobotrys conoides TaxID=74498 RepID=A0AAN8RW76_9PEZI
MTSPTPPPSPSGSISPSETDQEPLLPLYTPSTTLPPAYTTHRTDRLLLSSSSSSSSPSSEQILSESPDPADPPKQPVFSISGHVRIKVHNPLQLLHRILFAFLLLNTAVFALLVYKLDKTAILSVKGIEHVFCSCPLKQKWGSYAEFEFGGGYQKDWFSAGECSAVFNIEDDGVGRFIWGSVMYGKLVGWKECIEEAGRMRRWREWVLWVVMPVMCVLETAAAAAWWWCLRQEEKEEEKLKEGQQEGQEKEGQGEQQERDVDVGQSGEV